MSEEQKKGKSPGDKTNNTEMKFCDLCNISFSSDQELKEHVWSLMHHIKMEHRKKGSVHTCTLCYTTCADLKEYGTHLYLDKHLRALDQEKQEAQAAMEARLSARSKSPQRYENEFTDIRQSSYQNHSEDWMSSDSHNHQQHQQQQKDLCFHGPAGRNFTPNSPSSHPRLMHNNYPPNKVPLHGMPHNQNMPRQNLPHNQNMPRQNMPHNQNMPDKGFHDHCSQWNNEWGNNCVYAGFRRHAYQPGRRLNMQADQERFWQDDVWGWNQFTAFADLRPPNIFSHGPPDASMNSRPGQPGRQQGHPRTFPAEGRANNYKWKNYGWGDNSQGNEEGIDELNNHVRMPRNMENVTPARTLSSERCQKVKNDRSNSLERKKCTLEGRGRPATRVTVVDSKKVVKPRSKSSGSNERLKKNLRSLSKEKKNVSISIETNSKNGRRKVSVTAVESVKKTENKVQKLNTNPKSKSRLSTATQEKKNVVKSRQARTDRGADLLERAEKLCHSLRQQREEAKILKEKSQKDKEKKELNVLDEQISALSEKSKSHITGMISEEARKKYAPSKIFSEAKESDVVTTCTRTKTNKEIPCENKEDTLVVIEKIKELHDTRSQSDSRLTLNDPISSTEISANFNVNKESCGKFTGSTSSGGNVPLLLLNRTRSSRHRTDLLDKDQLMKLVNSPRSRKERLQLSQMLRSHSKSQQKTLTHPRFSLQVTPSVGDGKDPVDLNALSLSQLPYEVKLQIAELIEKDLQPDGNDSETECKEAVCANEQGTGGISLDDIMMSGFTLGMEKDGANIKSETPDATSMLSLTEDVKPNVALLNLDMSAYDGNDASEDSVMTMSELTGEKTAALCVTSSHVINSPHTVTSQTAAVPDVDSASLSITAPRTVTTSHPFSATEIFTADENMPTHDDSAPGTDRDAVIDTSFSVDKNSGSNKAVAQTVASAEESFQTKISVAEDHKLSPNNGQLGSSEVSTVQIHTHSAAAAETKVVTEPEDIDLTEDPDCIVIPDTKQKLEDIEISSSPEGSTQMDQLEDQSDYRNSGDIDIPSGPAQIEQSDLCGQPATCRENPETVIKEEKGDKLLPSASSSALRLLPQHHNSAELITSPSGAKRKKPLSPVLVAFEDKQETGMDFKRPKMEQLDDELSSPGYESSTSLTEASLVSTASRQDCVDQVLELSLREERVRSKLASVNSTVDRLHHLLQQTQQQLDKYLHVREKLIKEEEDLRMRRIEILRGAVAEKNTPSRPKPKEALSLNRSTSTTDAVVIDLCNVKEEQPSPSCDTVIQTLKFEADSTSPDQCKEIPVENKPHTVSIDPEDHTGNTQDSKEVVKNTVDSCTDENKPILQMDGTIQPKEETVTETCSETVDNDMNESKNVLENCSLNVKDEPASVSKDTFQSPTMIGKVEYDEPDFEDKSFRLTKDGILKSCSDTESERMVNVQKGQCSQENERLMMKYVRSIETPSVANSDVLKKIALDMSDDLGSSSYMYVEEHQLISDQERLEENLMSADNSAEDDLPVHSQDDQQIELDVSQDSNMTAKSDDVNVSKENEESLKFKIPAPPSKGYSFSAKHHSGKDTNTDVVSKETSAVTAKPPIKSKTIHSKDDVASNSQVIKQPSSSSSEESQSKKRLKSRKQRDISSSLTSLASITEDSSSDDITNDTEMNVPLSELSTVPGRKKRQRKNVEQEILKTHLHADSSSDVEMEGLDDDRVNTQTYSEQDQAAEDDRNDNNEKMDDLLMSDEDDGQHTSSDMEVNKTDKIDCVKRVLPKDKKKKFVMNEFTPEVKRFEGHSLSVQAMQIYDGALYTCSEDMTARKFDLKTQECIMVYQGHSKRVNCLLVTKIKNLGDRLFTGGFDNLLIAFDPKTGQCIARCRYADKIYSLCEGWGKLYIGLANGIVLSFHPGTNRTLDAFKCSERPVTAMTLAREGARNLLCVASADTVITIRDAQSGLLLRTLEGATKPIFSLQVMKNLIYSGCGDRKLYIHNLNTGELVASKDDHYSTVSAVRATPKLLITSGYDGMIRLYDPKNITTSPSLQVYHSSSAVTCMTIHESQIFSGNKHGAVEVVPICLESNYKCQWMNCGLVFAWRKHLQEHALTAHILLTNGKVRCLWAGCSEWIHNQNDSNEVAAEHIANHLSDDCVRKTMMDSLQK